MKRTRALHAIDTTETPRSTSQHGCGLGRLGRLDVCLGLRRTRAGARVGNAPVAYAGLPHTVPRGAAVSALVRARFCCILAAMLFWRFSPRDGAYFAGGLARWSYGLLSFVFCEFWVCIRRFEIRCTGQIEKFTGQLQNHGFFLLPIQITQIFSNQLSQRSPALGSMV